MKAPERQIPQENNVSHANPQVKTTRTRPNLFLSAGLMQNINATLY